MSTNFKATHFAQVEGNFTSVIPAQAGISPNILELVNVRKSFTNNLVLNDINLSVATGEVVCIVGASGSGKSTLMKCINLLERVDDGQIILDGLDITDPRINVDKARAMIGVVFQQYNLFPHLNVLDNVTLASKKVFKIKKFEAEEKAVELLKRIGLGDKLKVHPDRLSGGQQQRVAIIRSIMTNPKLLLLDEVTSALDPMLVSEVLQLIDELKTQDTTIVMATHEMEFAKNSATKMVFLSKGKLVEEGTPSEFFDKPKTVELKEFLSVGLK
jgi:polar amino acid transport system ATP-binding protein